MQRIYYFSCRGDGLKPRQKPVKVHERDTVTNRQKKLQYIVDDPNNVTGEFEKFVRTKYGFTKGIIGKELIEALENHLALHNFGPFKNKSLDFTDFLGPAHKHLKSNHQTLLSHLEDLFQEGEVIKFKQIQDVIRREFGRTDRRTHKSYVDALRSRELLIQPDGVRDYEYYFFKEQPQARENRPTPVVDVQTRLVFPGNKVFELLPGPGTTFTVQRLRKMTTLKDADFQTGLKQLTQFGIISDVGIGKFRVNEIEV